MFEVNAEAKFVSSVMDARLKKAKRERDSLRKQRDEIINDMAETKKKAEAFDEILEITEEDCWAEDFAVYISQVIDKYKEANHEG